MKLSTSPISVSFTIRSRTIVFTGVRATSARATRSVIAGEIESGHGLTARFLGGGEVGGAAVGFGGNVEASKLKKPGPTS